MAWADPHCHLFDERVRPLDGALFDARTAGVHRMITVGCDEATSASCIDDAKAARALGYDVWATVGVHPHEATTGIDYLHQWLVDPAAHNVIAVGECGLDYHYDHSPREVQREVFAAQVRLANLHELPLVIHTREAWDDTFAILRNEGTPASTIFHCFTGGPDEAQQCLELHDGVALSYSGIVTFPSAKELHEAAKMTPLDRLTVETDAPYLAPVPFRGKRNVPAYVPHVGAAIAELKQCSVAEVEDATWRNVARIFRLDESVTC